MKDLTFAAAPLAELPKSLKTHALRRMMRDWETLLASKTRKALPVSLMAVSLAACSDDEKEEAQAALNEFIEDEDLSEDDAEELQDAFDEIVEELDEEEDDSQDAGGDDAGGDEGGDEDEAADLPVVTPSGAHIPLGAVAKIAIVDGPEAPLSVLIPSFMLSEIARAFQIGFLIFLPFLIIDLVVAAILMSMGMMMVPPVVVSLPFKLAFFVIADGWRLIADSLVRGYF